MEDSTEEIKDTLSFRVDAGLIDRLGRELVGRAETAVSELVKNAYDADATSVNVHFIDSINTGGTLRIVDNGVGMTFKQLQEGFMTISSTDKIHNPQSVKFHRSKAGRKGIGRFATQRLGTKLTIITQTIGSSKALQLSIDWTKYLIDMDIGSIKNPIIEIEKLQDEGTILLIEGLREPWSEMAINRIYRYVSDLLQPDYLSDRSLELGLAQQLDESFKVRFVQINENQEKVIADPNKMLFSKSLAIIEGFIDRYHDGFCNVSSNSLELNDDVFEINFGKKNSNQERIENKYLNLKDVHFKAYYFIYNRQDYYTNISKLELTSIQKLSQEQGGIRLYRNGFRVLPYGEPNNDWLNIDRRYYDESGVINAPFGNHNLFGFVEVIDQNGNLFEETASREGLIENDAYLELKDFISKALDAGRSRIRYGVDKIRTKKKTLHPNILELIQELEKSPIEKLNDFGKHLNDFINNPIDSENTENYKRDAYKIVDELKRDFKDLLEELGMLRVLAGLGLTIGEFTHEVVQFAPSMNGDLSVIAEQNLDVLGIKALENLKRTIQLFISYTSYFNSTVSANVTRELKPQQIDIAVEKFREIIQSDLVQSNTKFLPRFYGYDLLTIPMHASEWSSILFNLYTNAKKAIKRANTKGQIGIVGGKEKNVVYLEFSDNGDGIPDNNKDRIFDAFFTTSSPVGFESTPDEKATGTGLGLKIVKDIIQTYGGSINIIPPETGYSTCFRIELPIATEKQREEYAI
jgi:signal transduction histidine kinase